MIIQIESGQKLEVPDGSTPEHIDEVLGHFSQSQGVKSPETPQIADSNGETGLATDAKNFVKSTAYSVPMGFGDEIRDVVAAGVASASPDLTFGEAYKQARVQSQEEQAQMRKESPKASFAGDITGSLLTGGAAAGTKAGASLANSLRSGNAVTRIAKGVATGAASGSAYGAGTAEGDNRLRGAVEGAIAGGVIGGAVPAVSSAVSGLKSTVAPKIGEATAALAQRAKDFGIPLRLDQVSPTRIRNTVQKVSQEIPFSGVDEFEAGQRKAFTKAVANTIGQSSDDLSPETVKNFLKESGNKFEDLLKGKTISFNTLDKQALDKIAINADDTITEDLAKIVRKNVDKLSNDLDPNGSISGEKLASFRSELIKRAAKAQGGAKEFLSDLVEVVDDVVTDHSQPQELEALKAVRRQWRNFKTIEPLLEKSTDGTINPTELMNHVKGSKYIKASRAAVGDDDLVDLARIGKELLPKKGGSDTFQKSALAGGSVAATAGVLTNPLATLVAGVGVPLANRGLQAVNSSQGLVGLAIKNSSKTAKKLKRPASLLTLEGAAGNELNRR